MVDSLLRSDPATFLPFLTTEAGPLLALARTAITAQVAAYTEAPSPELAEAAARFGLSLILTRDSVLPIDDPAALADAVRRMLRPFLLAFRVRFRQPRRTIVPRGQARWAMADPTDSLLALGTATLAESGGRPLASGLTAVWSGAVLAAPAVPVHCAVG